MLLYIIRHGDPIYNPDSLTEKGHLQAMAVGRRLATRKFDRIYASGMIRAQQTGKPLCMLTGKEMQIEDWTSESIAFKELSVVCQDGKRRWAFTAVPNTRLRTEDSLKAGDEWYKLPEFAEIDGEKAYQRIIDASDAFLARQGYVREGRVYRAETSSEDRIAVFCHQGFGLTWMSHLLQIPPHIMWSCFDVTHSSVSIFQFKTDEKGYCAPKCLCLSDMSHIYADRLPMVYNNEVEL